MAETLRQCGHCKMTVGPKADAAICSECGEAHHRTCWSRHDSCSTAGCYGIPSPQVIEPAIEDSVDEYPQKPTAVEDESQDGQTKKCPFCAELIRNDAIKCRFCLSMLNQTYHSAPTPYVSDLYDPWGEKQRSQQLDFSSDSLMSALQVLTFFNPLAGIIVGMVYNTSSNGAIRDKGRTLINFGLIMTAFSCVCALFAMLFFWRN